MRAFRKKAFLLVVFIGRLTAFYVVLVTLEHIIGSSADLLSTVL